MRQKGFIITELIIVVAILGILAAVLIPNILRLTSNDDNYNLFCEWSALNVSTLNTTQLTFLVDYCVATGRFDFAAVYQNELLVKCDCHK